MNATPNGQITLIEGRPHLRLIRTFRAPVEDVWASVTEPQRLERWIGTWTGTPGVGNTISFVMSAEEGAEPEDVEIRECDPPHRFVGDFTTGEGTWRIGLSLEETDGVTSLVFTQAVNPGDDTGSFGPGWEYYLDRLVAERLGTTMPDWDDYYPAQRPYYENLVAST